MERDRSTSHDWQDDANCLDTDPEQFFTESRAKRVIDSVKEICNSCEVREDCLEYAMKNKEQYGIWGGLTPEERRALGRRFIGRAAIRFR